MDDDRRRPGPAREAPCPAGPAAAALGAAAGARENRERPSSYRRILESTALMSAAALINMAIGMLRTKAVALLLGPAGVGLLGIYAAIADLAQTLAGMGLVSSGVRQIAEAAGTGDGPRVARVAQVLRRVSLLLGLLGGGVLALLAEPIARLSFGDDRHGLGVALLSLAVGFRIVADGRAALIQGLRRLGALGRMNILGTALAALTAVGLAFGMGEAGIALMLPAMAAVTALVAWWHGRAGLGETPAPAAAPWREAAALLRLGFAFMASGLMMSGAAYAIRLLVARQAGVEAAGLYQAAWTLGGLYLSFALQAMGTDFYPRLTAVAHDYPACNRMVNEQAHVSLLLAGPGILATLILAPWVLRTFYSPEFGAGAELLRWLCLGMALRTLSWPMGYIVLAQGAQGVLFWSEAAWTLVYLGLARLFMASHGLAGAGIAFFAAYLFHCLMAYAIARRLSGFRWSARNLTTGLLYLGAIALVFQGFEQLPPVPALVIGGAALALGGLHSLASLLKLLASGGPLPSTLGKWLGKLKLSGLMPIPGETSRSPAPNLSMERLIAVFLIAGFAYLWAERYAPAYPWGELLDFLGQQLGEVANDIPRWRPI